MLPLNRREFLSQSVKSTATAAATIAGLTSSGLTGSPFMIASAADRTPLEIATFRADVTPPMGHPLCGGWIKPVVGYDDSLEAIGYVLRGSGKPIVVCTLDFVGLLNEAHLEWRTAIAQAAGTTPDRVAIQCVHQHNAPFVCPEAERLVKAAGDLPTTYDTGYLQQCLDRMLAAVVTALKTPKPLTAVAHNQAKVSQVASIRRFLNEKGQVDRWRGSATADPALQALPEGEIDPWMKTVAFYSGEQKVAVCHYYASHPMSYYGDGRVSSEFVGLARKQRDGAEPGCVHLYFTGCSGNIAAGKYNDGTPASRIRLTERIHAAMVESEAALKPEPITSLSWTTSDLLAKPRAEFAVDKLQQQIATKSLGTALRIRGAMMQAWMQRFESQRPIVLSGLQINQMHLLHLPAESFLEYQFRAQQFAKDRFVACAAYGDGGPWYIPVEVCYPQGGYEVSVAFCDPEIDGLMTKGIQTLLKPAV